MASELRKERDRQRREKRLEELLEVSARLFADKGYHSTLVSDIAAEAQVGQGTIYRYFKDKRDILDKLFDRLVERLLEQFSEMSASPPSSEQEYRESSYRALSRVVEVLEKERDLAHLIIREGLSIDKGFARRLADFYENLASLAAFYLDHAIEQGFARPCDSRVVSQALVGMGVWMAHLFYSGRMPSVSLESLVTEVVDFAFDGFGGGVHASTLPRGGTKQ